MEKTEAIAQAKRLLKQQEYKKAWNLLKPYADDAEVRRYLQYIKKQVQDMTQRPSHPEPSPQPVSEQSKPRWQFIAIGISSVILVIIFVTLIVGRFSKSDSNQSASLATVQNTEEFAGTSLNATASFLTDIAGTIQANATATGLVRPAFTLTPSPTASATFTASPVVEAQTNATQADVQVDSTTTFLSPNMPTPIPIPIINRSEPYLDEGVDYVIASAGSYTEHTVTETDLTKLTVVSDDFLPLISLHDADGNLLARAIRTFGHIDIPDDRVVTLRVQATNNKLAGSYRFSIQPNSRVGLAYTNLNIGYIEINEGYLIAGTDATWRFFGITGERIGFRFRASFNAMLEVRDENGQILEQFDSEGYEWRYYISEPLPDSESDFYTLTIRAIDESASGTYEIEYSQVEPFNQTDADQPILDLALNDINTGRLNSFSQQWRFSTEANSSVRVDIADDYQVAIYSVSGERMVYSSTVGLWDLTDGSDYILTVSPTDPRASAERGLIGSPYDLTVTEIGREFSLTIPSVALGEAPAGVIDTYEFEGLAGQRISIGARNINTTANYDHALVLYAPDGTLLVVDDDSEELNPQITNFVLPETGTYKVQVSGYDQLTPLNYRLSIIEGTDEINASSSSDQLNLQEYRTFNIPAGGEQSYQITGEANDIILLEVGGSSGIVHTLTSLGTNTVIEQTFKREFVITSVVYELPQTGTYTLTLRMQNIDFAGSGSIFMTKHDNLEDTLNDVTYLELGIPITDAYQQYPLNYEFDATAHTVYRLDIQNADLVFEDFIPEDFTDYIFRQDVDSAHVILFPTSTGNYSFSLRPDSRDVFGDFDLLLTEVSTATERLTFARDISFNDNQRDVTGRDGMTSYRFQGDIGDEIGFNLHIDDNQSGENARLSFTIFNDAGDILASGNSDLPLESLTLQRSGEILIDVYGAPDQMYSYTITTTNNDLSETLGNASVIYSDVGFSDQGYTYYTMVLGADNRLLIVGAYGDSIELINCMDITCTFLEKTLVVNLRTRIEGVDVVIGTDGLPVIGYATEAGEYVILRCSDPDCNGHTSAALTVDFFVVSPYIKLLITDDNLPMLTTVFREDIWFISCVDVTCAKLDVDTFNMGRGVSALVLNIAMQSDNTPFIAYVSDIDREQMNVVDCATLRCTSISFSGSVAFAPNWAGDSNVMLLRENDLPVFIRAVTGSVRPDGKQEVTFIGCLRPDCSEYERNIFGLFFGVDEQRVMITNQMSAINPDNQLVMLINYFYPINSLIGYDLLVCEDFMCSDYQLIRTEIDTGQGIGTAVTQLLFNDEGLPVMLSSRELIYCQNDTCGTP